MLVRIISPRAACVALLTCALLRGTPSLAQEGADRVYREGVEAVEKARWADAASAMRQAIDINPTEAGGRRIPIFGGRDYLPHLLLGRALLAQSDCTGALNAWEQSDNQGVARKLRNGEHAKEIDRGYGQCEAKGFLPSPKFRKELDEARAAVRAAADERARLAEHVSSADDAIKAAHRKLVTLAENRLQTANEKLATGDRTRKAQELTDARAAAGLALTDFRGSRAPIDVMITARAGFQAKIRAADSELAAVEGRAREIDTLVNGPPKVPLSDAIAASRTKTDSLVTAARERIRAASGAQTDATLIEAAQLTAEADKGYRQVRFEIESLVRTIADRELQVVKTRMQDTLAGLEARAAQILEAFSTQPPSDAQSKEFESARRGLDRARQAFDRAIVARDLAGASGAVRATPRLAAQLDALAAALALAVPTLPESLKAAAQAFFGGSYADAVRLLPSDAIEAIDRRFRIHGYVVRAAALFGLYQRSGGADASLRQQALREVEQSRALDPSFQPNPAAFSPRFLAFFRSAPPS